MKATLLRIGIDLTKDGFKPFVWEYVGDERTLTYVVRHINQLQDEGRRRIAKERIMKLDYGSGTAYEISVAVWCLPEQQEEALRLCTAYIIKAAKQMQEQVNKLVKQLPQTIDVGGIDPVGV